MAFMKPEARRMGMYIVETDSGTEYVPDECPSGYFDCDAPPEELTQVFRSWIEGQEVFSVERRGPAWYARLAAPGYTDSTPWTGPSDTAAEALDYVKDLYDIDDEGEDR